MRAQEEQLKNSVKKSDLQVTFKCPSCLSESIQSFDELYFSHDSHECDTCGSHGRDEISFNCSNCNYYFEIIDSW